MQRANRFLWFVLAIGGVFFTLTIVGFLSLSHFVWDDAYMFVRYSDNILDCGTISWNPKGTPTYGLTSILYLAVMVPMRLLTKDNPFLTATLSSLLCGFLFLGFLSLLLWRFRTNRTSALLVLSLVSVCIAGSSEAISAHFLSGMDTTFDMAYLTVYILLCKGHQQTRNLISSVAVGIAGGLSFFVRPDLLLFALLVPIGIILSSTDPREEFLGAMILGITFILLCAGLLFAMGYFQSFLPLGFFAKSQKLYGDYIYRQYHLVSLQQLLLYLQSYWPLFLLTGASLGMDFRGWFQKDSALDTAVLIATFLFLLYYLVFVLQIMYYYQRFYYPTLPAVIYLAAQSVNRIIKKIPEITVTKGKDFFATLPSSFLWCIAISVCIAILPSGNTFSALYNLATNGFGSFSVTESYRLRFKHVWFGLEEFSRIEDDLVIAATEVGHLSAFNPFKTIIDLSGLNDTEFAHNGFSADVLFGVKKPDLVYMPHPHYREMIEQILTHPIFVAEYEYFPPEVLGRISYRNDTLVWSEQYISGVAIRKGSRHYTEMKSILTAAIARGQ